jgi:hypothetical protein
MDADIFLEKIDDARALYASECGDSLQKDDKRLIEQIILNQIVSNERGEFCGPLFERYPRKTESSKKKINLPDSQLPKKTGKSF